MRNDSYTAEKYYDNLYERSEDASDCTCPECLGEGETNYCMNCGLHYDECKCDEPDLITEKCERCFGRGEI